MDDLEKACKSQLMAQATGKALSLPPSDVCEHSASMYERAERGPRQALEWETMKRSLNRAGVPYDQ